MFFCAFKPLKTLDVIYECFLKYIPPKIKAKDSQTLLTVVKSSICT